MNGNMFGGGFFGKSIPLARPGQAAPGGPAPTPSLQGAPQQPVAPLGVVPPPQTAMGPQGPVPLGAKKDCPICRG